MRILLLVVALTVSLAAQSERPAPTRKQSLTRWPELYEQNTPPTAMGLWFDGVTVGVIGWEGQHVPCAAQVAIKGRNFVGRGVLVILKHSVQGELTDTVYLLPRTHYDAMPMQMESCAFDLPPFIHGLVTAQLLVNGIESNIVKFEVE